jgi:spermidine synthase
MHPVPAPGYKTYMEEGIEGVVFAYSKGKLVKNYINGLAHGGRPSYTYMAEAIEGARFVHKLRNVLVIGFGTGTFVEAMLKIKSLERLTLVEINRTLLKNLSKITELKNILSNPKLEVVIDDGRRYLLRNKRKYDMILMDPLRPTTAYSNNIYSKQFMDIVRRHLNPGGVFLIWTGEHHVLPKTVAAAFKFVRAYNMMCLGSERPFSAYDGEWEELLDAPSPKLTAKIKHKLETNLVYLGGRDYVLKNSAGYPINQDWRPNVEYYLGLRK